MFISVLLLIITVVAIIINMPTKVYKQRMKNKENYLLNKKTKQSEFPHKSIVSTKKNQGKDSVSI